MDIETFGFYIKRLLGSMLSMEVANISRFPNIIFIPSLDMNYDRCYNGAKKSYILVYLTNVG